MDEEEKKCPMCGQIAIYFEIAASEPFTATSPMEGLIVWGPYGVSKKILCQNEKWVHFRFGDMEERLVLLTVS